MITKKDTSIFKTFLKVCTCRVLSNNRKSTLLFSCHLLSRFFGRLSSPCRSKITCWNISEICRCFQAIQKTTLEKQKDTKTSAVLMRTCAAGFNMYAIHLYPILIQRICCFLNKESISMFISACMRPVSLHLSGTEMT